MDRCRYTSASAAAELSSKPEKFAMFTRWMTLLLCLACAVYLAAEALPRQLPTSPRLPTPSPALDNDIFQPTELDGRELLERAIKKLKSITWLRLTIGQRMHGSRGFESSAELTLGPNDCAALDLTVKTGDGEGQPVRQRVICDGQVIATVNGDGEADGEVRGQRLPPSRRARVDLLHAHGCAPPAVLLRQVRGATPRWTVEQGTRAGRRVLRLSGPLDRSAVQASRWAALGANQCSVELDAETLWPRRFEWRRLDGHRGSALVLEMEYREAEVNRPLSLEECARVFSYLPQSDTDEKD
jgi:hypothetical protein